jgi:hypothetical protein
MNKTQNRNLLQSGQAILVVALVMVGLIGALGLAVDGGGLAFLYRDAQNAADAAALAAAYARCAGGDDTSVLNAARTAAADNGFTNTGTSDWVTVGPAAGHVGNPNFVSVTVRATKQAYFIQILYPQGLEATAGAVAQCTPAIPGDTVGLGYAIYGTGPRGGVSATCHGGCDAVEARLLTVQGDVYSNDGTTYSVIGGVPIAVTGTTYRSSTGVFPDPLAHLDPSQFAPGGSVWNSIPADRRTYVPMGGTVPNFRYLASGTSGYFNDYNGTGRSHWQVTDPTLLHGLYYVEGDITINANNKTLQPFTIVATGRIDIRNASKGVTGYAQAGNLLAYTTLASTSCNDNVLVVSEGAMNSHGVVYAPNGQIEILYNNGTWVGSIVGKWVDWWTYDGRAATLRAMPMATPPIVGLVS